MGKTQLCQIEAVTSEPAATAGNCQLAAAAAAAAVAVHDANGRQLQL
jgi:hypothetical protein